MGTFSEQENIILIFASLPEGGFLEYPKYHNFVDCFLYCWTALGNKFINKSH